MEETDHVILNEKKISCSAEMMHYFESKCVCVCVCVCVCTHACEQVQQLHELMCYRAEHLAFSHLAVMVLLLVLI